MTERMLTDHGTPGAKAWSLEWFERVDALEHELGRRICGGVCPDGTPCRRTSTHSSGRCSHHGGNHLTGAPKGNENARVHGLYSRRLQRCDARCVMWGACPFAEEDLLEIPLGNRPNCVYEQAEYDRLVWHYAGMGEAVDVHLAHTVALLQVMVSRAAAALSIEGFTDTTRATGEQYSMESSKIGAALQAFLRLAREHRQYRRDLLHEIAAAAEKTANQKPLGLPDRMRPLLKKAEGVLEDNLAYQKRRLAALGPIAFLIDDENERFYETHGLYPAEEEWEKVDEDEDEDEEEGEPRRPDPSTDCTDGHRLKRERDEEGEGERNNADKDQQDGRDELSRDEQKAEEHGKMPLPP